MIKVLHLVPSVNIMCGDFGVVMNYYKHINRQEVQFDIGYINDTQKDNIGDIEQMGGKVYKLTCPSMLKGAKQFVNELQQILKNGDYKVVHLHMPIFHRFVKKAIKGFNVKLIIHIHSSKFSSTMLKSIRNAILKIGINKGVDYRLACSKIAGQKWFGKSFLTNKNDVFLRNSIELDKFKFNQDVRNNIRQDLDLQDDEIAICHIGRFSKEKNHKQLIKIFNHISQKSSKVKLFLIGEGKLKSEIQRLVEQYKLSNRVVFMGFRKDVPDVLNAMDIFMLPSKFEGLGLALVEAQASGLLCYASTGCPPESKISNKVSYLKLNNPQSWVDQIVNDLQKTDFNNRENNTRNMDYDINYQAVQLSDFYKRITNG